LTYCNSPTTLTAFDIQPRKSPKPLSTEARAAATAKARATRQARGTTSKKEKAAIILCEHLEGLGMIELSAVA
jgi:hypothetical protein